MISARLTYDGGHFSDRYWGFLSKCRMPFTPGMPLPFACPMDALYETPRWNKKGVRYREHTFLDNPHVPAALKRNRVTLTVALPGQPVAAPTADTVELPYGTPLSEVRAAVLKANPGVRLVQVANADLRRLCRWLGSRKAAEDFNTLTRYISRSRLTYDLGEAYL
jgi:hypothetical protein